MSESGSLLGTLNPFSGQVSIITSTVVLLFVFGYLAWKKLRGGKSNNLPHIPNPKYKVVKSPPAVEGKKKKRTCAVVGGTGFVGSHIVDELIRKGDYYVYVLGRTFRPERTNPKAHCLIQVDILDLDGMTKAFQGVESVINAASIVPDVFMSADSIWNKNKTAQENVLKAAKKAGVENLVFVSGLRSQTKPKSREMKALRDIFAYCEEMFVNENGKDDFYTCAVAPCNIIGLNKPYIEMFLSGEMTSGMMSDVLPVSFAPAEYVAKSTVSAESKLAVRDDQVCGKVHPLRGQVMSWRKLMSLPSWPHKISESPYMVFWLLVQINIFCVSVFGKAPFGGGVSPTMMEILSSAEEECDESEFQRTYDVLEIGPPKPPMEQYIREMAQRYQQREKPSKEKSKDK